MQKARKKRSNNNCFFTQWSYNNNKWPKIINQLTYKKQTKVIISSTKKMVEK